MGDREEGVITRDQARPSLPPRMEARMPRHKGVSPNRNKSWYVRSACALASMLRSLLAPLQLHFSTARLASAAPICWVLSYHALLAPGCVCVGRLLGRLHSLAFTLPPTPPPPPCLSTLVWELYSCVAMVASL